MDVAVVIPTYNHAHFLGPALESILGQTMPAAEILVVDDGSTDDPAKVVAGFPSVRLISQENQGLAAARNTGLRAARSPLVLFLDADDVLCDNAIEASVAAMERNPGAAFVYGAYRHTDAELTPIGEPRFKHFRASAYHALLHDNVIGMHATVLYDRAKLLACGGFDETLGRCEDYDVYLRLAREHPVGCHPEVVALYRMHDANMSSNPVEMLDSALGVHERHKPAPADAAALRAWHNGKRYLKLTYASQAWEQRYQVPDTTRRQQMKQLFRSAPVASAVAAAWQGARRALPARAQGWLKQAMQRTIAPLGSIDMGDLARTKPVSRQFGYDRGTPIDRYYIEAFLETRTADIAGRVLEIGEATYSRRFGSGVTQQDVLHVSPDNPAATIIGDLAQPQSLPRDAFDCMVITQTLHLIYDMAAAVEQMRVALKPGGVVLLTVPGVSSVDRDEWGAGWCWSLTGYSTQRLFAEAFGSENVSVEVHGNVYAATCFLQGLAVEEVQASWLEATDPAYPVLITVRAQRAA